MTTEKKSTWIQYCWDNKYFIICSSGIIVTLLVALQTKSFINEYNVTPFWIGLLYFIGIGQILFGLFGMTIGYRRYLQK